MKPTRFTTLLATLGLSLVAAQAKDAAPAKEASQVTAMEKAWAQMAACSDMTEITLAKAAEQKSQSEHVKTHAARMIKDHSKTTAELKQWASANGVVLKDVLPPEKQACVDEITSKSGEEFDKAYMNEEVAGHRHAVVHFRNGTEFLKDAKLKGFAKENLPTIKEHLAEVEMHAGGAKKAEK